jgi:hypothetical protein
MPFGTECFDPPIPGLDFIVPLLLVAGEMKGEASDGGFFGDSLVHICIDMLDHFQVGKTIEGKLEAKG